MDPKTLLFWIFSLVTVFSAARVITARNPVHAALYLVLTFFTSACIWMLLKAEFLAITLVLVYVGAVMVLFLFVVMMLDVQTSRIRREIMKHRLLGGVVGAVIVLELAAVLWPKFNTSLATDVPRAPADYSNTQALGQLLYTQYLYPLEIAGAILLVAMVAAIGLTLRHRKDTRTNDISAAVRTRASDRVRLVKMPAQPRPDSEDAAK